MSHRLLIFFLAKILAEQPDRRIDETQHIFGNDDLELQPEPLDFGFDITKECYDLSMHRSYAIDETWIAGTCEYYKCRKVRITRLRNTEIAVPVKQQCAEIGGPEKYCTVLVKTNDLYPTCCPIMTCVLGDKVNITGTLPNGEIFHVNKTLTPTDLSLMMANESFTRLDMIDFAMRRSSLNH